jgi:Cu-Zn family superoxide dismutase
MLTRTRARRTAAGGAALLLAAAAATAASSAAGSGGSEDQGARTDTQARTTVVLHNVAGDSVGRVTLRQLDEVVLVRAWVRSMTPGFHGFHVHTIGLCEAHAAAGPFTTAGGHFTGGATTHGDHAGDMPSLLVTQAGRAYLEFVTDRFTLADLRDADGSAVMVHEGRDNFANIPTRYLSNGVPGPDATTLATGDAGSRAACGVVH